MELLRMTRFEEIYARHSRKELSCEEASDILGCSARHFLRLRRSYAEGGIEALRDGRAGGKSSRRAEDEEIELVTKLYTEKYRGMSVAHFHDYAIRKHGLARSYNWTRCALNGLGLTKPTKRGGPHRLRRPRKPMRGMMLHQDGSTHEWVPGKTWDLIVTMDDATSEILSGFFTEQEGTDSTFRGLLEVSGKHGIFCSFYTDRGSHYFYTGEAGGKVDKSRLTQVGRALRQLNIRHIAAYSPQARGRSERLFGTLQDRLVKELALEGITEMAEANRYLRETYIPFHNKKFAVEPESSQSAFLPVVGVDLKSVFCIQEERMVQNDNTVRYAGLTLQIPASSHRHHYVRAQVRVNRYPDGSMALYYGPLCIGEYEPDGRIRKMENKETQAIGKKENQQAA
jgi:transposase